jgi:hypothetical protein
MESGAPLPPLPEPPKGLPVVEPPSGKFIAQLFLVPLLIVLVLVCFYVFVKWWVDSAFTPGDYLTKLDNPNPDIRWRGAEDLAQVLLRDDQLASDPKFGLDLADRLRAAIKHNAEEEKTSSQGQHKPSKTELDQARASLRPGREYSLYLTACLGNMTVPIGAPLLAEMAMNKEGSDPWAVFQRRRHALWALANLGKNLKRFDALPEKRRDAVRDELESESAGSDERAQCARRSQVFLWGGDRSNSLEALGVDKALTACAEDPNPFLREVSALALNFWEGLPAEKARMDDLLVKLTHDNGHGEDILAGLRDEERRIAGYREEEQQTDVPVSKIPGLTIRFNATIALARRGSDKLRLGLLQEMLDPALLRERFRVTGADGKEVPVETLVAKTLEGALEAVAELHRKRPERDLTQFSDKLEALAHDANLTVRSEAERTLRALKDGK